MRPDSALGIRVADATVDRAAQTVRWKDGIVARLTSGVGALLKKATARRSSTAGRDQSTARPSMSGRHRGESRVSPAQHLRSPPARVPVELPGAAVRSAAVDLSSDRSAAVRLRCRSDWSWSGAGYIGLELGIAYRKLGAEVTVVEVDATAILPAYDEELTRPVWPRCSGSASSLHLGSQRAGADDKAARRA